MKLSKRQHFIYDIIISSLAVFAVALIIIDLSEGLKGWEIRADQVILAVFVVDYLVRLHAAADKGRFVRSNICDLIAILPFHTVFRAFKIVRSASLLKLFKLPRLFAFLYRPLRKAKAFFNTNGFKYVVFVTVLLIGLGGILIHFAEGMSLGDGIWWAFVTATTVGYGDISPHTLYGRIIAMFLMIVGIGLLGTVTSTITSYFLRANRKTVRSAALDLVRERLDDFESLSAEDVEEICGILKGLKQRENAAAPNIKGSRERRKT